MTARELINRILNSVDSIDEEVCVRIVKREEEGYSVIEEARLPITYLASKAAITIESKDILFRPLR